jgi:nitrate/TMAO reductase-like tetraheme cytochrome c subunit
MHRLSPIILLLGLTFNLFAQNPHGVDFKTDCATCHSSKGWEIDPEFWENNDPSKQIISDKTRLDEPYTTKGFDHSTTEFSLEGQHSIINCRECHESLVFSEARSNCYSCHTDMHNQTVGFDCARCHNSENWLVADITQLHYDNGFPLLGAHYVTSCYDCHLSETDLRFERIGNDCINCHMDEYSATTNPNHVAADFSTNCIECHSVNGFDWTTENINHAFFPLTGGHDIVNCAECHTSGDYNNTPTDCYACHQEDYISAINPNHQSQGFPTDCMQCHTTDPDWTPARYDSHDAEFFPINSGEHVEAWNSCADCHTITGNYSVFACIDCHEHSNQADLEDKHSDFPDYTYTSQGCFDCHPTGDAD